LHPNPQRISSLVVGLGKNLKFEYCMDKAAQYIPIWVCIYGFFVYINELAFMHNLAIGKYFLTLKKKYGKLEY